MVDRAATVGGRVHSIALGTTPVDAGASHVWSFYSRTRWWIQRLGLGAALVPAGGLGSLGIAATDLPGIVRAGLDVARLWRRLDFRSPQRAAPFDRASIRDYASRHLSAQLTSSAVVPSFEWNAFCSLSEMSQVLLLQGGRLFLRARPYRMRGGLQLFPEALARGLDLRLGSRFATRSLAFGPGGAVAKLADGSSILCSAVVVATGPGEAADLAEFAPSLDRFLRGVAHSTVVREWWNLPGRRAFRNEPLRLSFGVSSEGVAVARPAGDDLFLSLALYGRAVREMGSEEVDSAMEQLRIGLLLGSTPGQPMTRARFRWDSAVTIFAPGHFRQLDQLVPSRPQGRVVLAGDYLVSPTVEGAVLSGERAAAEVMRLPILER